jgi:misacylated tRNA(Ala) deacylase
MDFDLSEVDNDVLRGLDADVNAVIGAALEVRSVYIDASEAASTAGLVRSLSVAPPPTPDGRLRIIEIAGIDRQACGGTHLANTGQSSPFRITKVESKGKRNRRMRFALGDEHPR